MTEATRTAARELLKTIQSDWFSANPSNAKYYVGFFKRCRSQLLQTAVAAIAQRRTSTVERLDFVQTDRWHELNANGLASWLAKADEATAEWLLTRVPAHRPDLASVTNQWARKAGKSVPDCSEIARAVPAVLNDRLWLLSLSDTGVIGGVIPQNEFRRFAAMTWEEEEATPGGLLDIAVGWFGSAEAIERAKAQDGPLPEWKLQQQFDALMASNAGSTDEELIRKEARKAVQVRRWLLDAVGLQIPEPHRAFVITAESQDGPSLAEIEELLGQIREDFMASEREASNLAIAGILPESLRRAAWPILLTDSGWGSLSIDQAKDRLPEAWGQATDRLIRAWVDDLPLYERASVNALKGSLDTWLLWPRYDETLLRAETRDPTTANRQKFEIAYIGVAGGYILPVCSTEPPEIKCRCKRITLKSHQRSVTRRLIAIRRCLLGNGIATVAALRLHGSRCRPPDRESRQAVQAEVPNVDEAPQRLNTETVRPRRKREDVHDHSFERDLLRLTQPSPLRNRSTVTRLFGCSLANIRSAASRRRSSFRARSACSNRALTSNRGPSAFFAAIRRFSVLGRFLKALTCPCGSGESPEKPFPTEMAMGLRD